MPFSISKVVDFLEWFKTESDGTRKVLGNITDAALAQEVADGHRNLGRAAWHIVTTYPEMLGQMGLKTDGATEKDPVPGSAAEIQAAYAKAADSLLDQIKSNWTDADLSAEREMYGMKWPQGAWLVSFVTHEIHHRGQMTVLMRQADLPVPGVYGPSKEEWKAYGMEVPEV